MKLVLEIAENCEVDVVFTDVDTIFYKNPFQHDLGRLIRSKRHDYIYQSNFEPTGVEPPARIDASGVIQEQKATLVFTVLIARAKS